MRRSQKKNKKNQENIKKIKRNNDAINICNECNIGMKNKRTMNTILKSNTEEQMMQLTFARKTV